MRFDLGLTKSSPEGIEAWNIYYSDFLEAEPDITLKIEAPASEIRLDMNSMRIFKSGFTEFTWTRNTRMFSQSTLTAQLHFIIRLNLHCGRLTK